MTMCDKNGDEMSRHDNNVTISRNLDIAMVALDQNNRRNDYDNALTSSGIINSKLPDNATVTDVIQNQNTNEMDNAVVVTNNNNVMIRNNDNNAELLQYKHQAQESSNDTTTHNKMYYPPDIKTNKSLRPEIIHDVNQDANRINHMCSTNTNGIMHNQTTGGMDTIVTNTNVMIRNNDSVDMLNYKHQAQDTTSNYKTYYPQGIDTNKKVKPAIISDAKQDANHVNHMYPSNANDLVQNQNTNVTEAAVTNNAMIRNHIARNDIGELLNYKHQAQESPNDTTTNNETYYPPDIDTNEQLTPEIIPDAMQYTHGIDSNVDVNLHNNVVDTENIFHDNREPNVRQKPGAIPVAGINEQSESPVHTNIQRVDHAFLETSSGLHIMEDGQAMIGSITLEFDGYLPETERSNNENNYLVPDENIQRLEHMYASDKPNASLDNHHVDLVTNMTFHQSMKKYLKKYCLLIVLMILLMSAIIIGSICGSSKCNNNTNDTVNQATNTVNQDNAVNQTNTIKYQSFYTKTELINAVDILISGENVTPSLNDTYGNISYWNVSIIQDFSQLFDAMERNNKHRNFNEDISRWDVSSATNMSKMFYGAGSFRGDISKWNISRVIDMSGFMAEANFFDSNLSAWDTSQITNASRMFLTAQNFKGDGLEWWNTSNMIDTSQMFRGSRSFRGNVSKWDMSRVIDTTRMFAYASDFDSDLSSWNVSNVKNMFAMFAYSGAFRGMGLQNWNTGEVETMDAIFEGASSFDANLSKWNVAKVKSMLGMFKEATSFQGIGLEYWDTSQVINFGYMFSIASSFDANLSQWDTSQAKDMSLMFYNASSFRGIGSVENWNVSNVLTAFGMFYEALLFDANLSQWDVSKMHDMSFMFSGASSFRGNGSVENWNVSNVLTAQAMFYDASIFDANLSQWDVSQMHDMTLMFSGALSFQGIGLEFWDTSAAKSLFAMFQYIDIFNANLSSWNVSNVNDMSNMFYQALSFEGKGLDKWNTSSVMSTQNMFYEAQSFNENLTNWDVSHVYYMYGMFENAVLFEGIGLDHWNISNVNITAYMFASAISFNANLSGWDYKNIQNMTDMFHNATSFEGVFWMDS